MMSRNFAPTSANSTQIPRAISGGFAGHFFLVAGARALRESGEQRNQRDGVDHDEKHDEEFDELFDHWDVASRKNYILRESTHWELNGARA